jgi:2'-hydroxyisoflavone reductase
LSRRTCKVALLGGSGFVGHAIAEELIRHGHSVVTINRKRTPADYSGSVERVEADRGDPLRYAAALATVDADAVVDVTAYRAEETRLAIEAFRGRIGRFVHISTLSVYDWPFPCPVAEDWPLVTDPAKSYGSHKAACERMIQAEPTDDFPWTILRLPAVFGPRDPHYREASLLHSIMRGEPVFLPMRPFLCQNLYVEDAARAVRLSIESFGRAGRVYNAGGPPFLLEEYANLIGELLGKPPRLVRASRQTLAQSSLDPEKVPYYFEGDLVLDTHRICDELAFEPIVERERAMRLTLDGLSRRGGTDAAR